MTVRRELLALFNYLINDSVFLGLHRTHDAVAVNVFFDLFKRDSCMRGQDFIQSFTHADDFFGLNLDVAGLT